MGKIKTAFAVLAIASACLSFVLMALPTPTIGIMFITLSLFFSFLWFVASLGEDVSEVKQWEKTNK